jgi:hypothetical protein
MRKWFIVFTILAILLLPAAVKAQNTVSFSSVDVSVWPEYDTPAVLVIYKIALDPQTSFPIEITMRLPATVQKPNAVAVGKTPETVSDQGVEYKFVPGTDSATLTIKATDPYIQMEYYDPALAKNGTQRQYIYNWLGDFSVGNFRFELREPLKSSNLSVDPALTNTLIDGDGFQFSEWKMAGLKNGQKLSFNISYQRDTDSPSTSFLQVQSSLPLDQNIQGQSSWNSYLPWALGALGIVLLLIAAGVYLASGRTSRVVVVSRSRKRHSIVNKEPDDDEEHVHCAQCGKRAQPGDRFCRACGARIRQSGE